MTDNTALRMIQEIEKDLDKVRTKVSIIQYEVKTLQDEAKRLEDTIKDLSGNVVTKEKFAPYEKLLSAVGIAVLLAIVGAIMASILK